jgi:hypothetical protein
VTTDTTGLYSFATKFKSFDIMFHVLNELPFTPLNRQQLLRKRHIGNDMITFIFQSKQFKGKAFNPSIIRSHFQHVFFIIRPLESLSPKGEQLYRVAVARHKNVLIITIISYYKLITINIIN